MTLIGAALARTAVEEPMTVERFAQTEGGDVPAPVLSTDLSMVATEKAKKHPYLKFVDWDDQEGVDRVFKVIGMRYIASLTDAEIAKGATP